MNAQPRIRLGAGAGFSGDRIDPAVQLAQSAHLDYLIFECLGERTTARAQSQRLHDSTVGYDPMLKARLSAVLPHTVVNRTTVLTNAGAANPLGAADLAAHVASDLALSRRLRIAAITGDDVIDVIRRHDPIVWETGLALSQHPETLVSANAYIGAEAILPALAENADVVIGGRLADPALYLAPLIHRFGWAADDYQRLGAGVAVGHLLECAGQLTGGYFADPVTKPVPNMAHLGFPFADVNSDGSATFGKVAGSGGMLTTQTCAEQLLYEVGNPHRYLTPDVTADFSSITFRQEAADRVSIDGAAGALRPDELKVTLGFRGGWTGEGSITYCGTRALARAELAATIVLDRLEEVHGIKRDDVSVEFIGAGAAFRGLGDKRDPAEVRMRIAARTSSPDDAVLVGWEIESLYTNGPAGGGGVRRDVTEVVSVRSCLLPRALVRTEVHLQEAPR